MQFNVELGQRLRQARKSRGWSLLEIEDMTDGDFKASVMGAYERGERSVSAHRLCKLADLYEVPAGSLLPAPYDGSDEPLVIDLSRAENLSVDQAEIDEFSRSVRELSEAGQEMDGAIQVMRKDPTGLGMAVRQSDLHILNSFISEQVEQPQAVFEES